MWLTTVVLPVMRIHAVTSVMFDIIEGTPQSLVVEDEEVDVLLVVVDEVHPNFVFSVGEGTVLSILAAHAILWVVRAKLSLIFLQAVELFDLIVTL